MNTLAEWTVLCTILRTLARVVSILYGSWKQVGNPTGSFITHCLTALKRVSKSLCTRVRKGRLTMAEDSVDVMMENGGG